MSKRGADTQAAAFPEAVSVSSVILPREGPGHDMVHLTQFTVAVAELVKVELVVFYCFAQKHTFLDRGDKKCNGIPVIQLMDEITLGSTCKDDCLTMAKRRERAPKCDLHSY